MLFKRTMKRDFWYPFFAKFVGPTAKIWILSKIVVPETIKGVLQPSKVLELFSSFSSYCLTSQANV